jgi:hypothetical protein
MRARRIPVEVAEGPREKNARMRSAMGCSASSSLSQRNRSISGGQPERGGGRHLRPAIPYGSHAPAKVVTGGGGSSEGNPGFGKKRRGRARDESTSTVRSERATSPLRTDGRQRPAPTGSSRCRWLPTPLTSWHTWRYLCKSHFYEARSITPCPPPLRGFSQCFVNPKSTPIRRESIER